MKWSNSFYDLPTPVNFVHNRGNGKGYLHHPTCWVRGSFSRVFYVVVSPPPAEERRNNIVIFSAARPVSKLLLLLGGGLWCKSNAFVQMYGKSECRGASNRRFEHHALGDFRLLPTTWHSRRRGSSCMAVLTATTYGFFVFRTKSSNDRPTTYSCCKRRDTR